MFPILNNSIKNGYDKVVNNKTITTFLAWSKSKSFAWANGNTIHGILSFINQEIKKDNITTRANSVAFSLFLAIFPFIIFLFTLLPYLPFTEDYTNLINTSSRNLLPNSAHEYLMTIIKDLTQIKRGGLLSLGFLFALYFSSNGIMSLMTGFDKSYREYFKKRSIIYKRAIALFLTLLLGVLFVGSIGLFVVGKEFFIKVDQAVMHEHDDTIFNLIISLVKISIALGMLFLGINSLFYFGPSFRKKLPFVNPGSIFSSILVLITSILFAFFINNFGKFNEIYGSIGALIVILLWLKINAFILLMGFELNAAITIFRK